MYSQRIYHFQIRNSVGGIVVSIAAFQAVDPGSIPGQRRDFLCELEISHSKYHNK